MDSNDATTPKPPTPAPDRGRRWLRRLAVFAVCSILLASFGLWLGTRSFVLTWVAKGRIEARLGGTAEIAAAGFVGNGRFVFRDIVVRTNAIDGEAGELARIGRAEITFGVPWRPWTLPPMRSVEMHGVRLRLSEDSRAHGRFNYMTLAPDPDAKMPPLPRLRIHDGQIEYGTHDGSSYRSIGSRHVSGDLYPASDDETEWYEYTLGEIDEAGLPLGAEGVYLMGRWNVVTQEHRGHIDGIEFDERTLGMCPQTARFWCERMELAGRVAGVELAWGPDTPFTFEFDVDNVLLRMPVETGELWVRYRDGTIEADSDRPRMRVRSGRIRLVGDRLELDHLDGELGVSGPDDEEQLQGVPYVVSGAIEAIPQVDWENRSEWLAQVRDLVPFEMTFKMRDFSVASGREDAEASDDDGGRAIELPRVVARALEKFEMTDWSLSTQVDVRRAPPVPADDGETLVGQPIETDGQAFIRDGAGAFERFPYRLDDVEAYLRFDNERVTIHYLNGRGSHGAPVRMTGHIDSPGRENGVSLDLIARDVPLDGRLRDALRPGERKAFDALLHRQSADSLLAAGLIADETRMARVTAERLDLLTEIAGLRRGMAPDDTAGQARIAELQRRARRLGRLIEAGPFELGGLVDMDLDIRRPPGKGNRARITGTIDIHSGGIVFERFPYPIVVHRGRLEWNVNQIRAMPGPGGKGIEVSTLAGGQGWMTGHIDLSGPPGQRKIEPHLSLHIGDDALNDALSAAIPLSPEERAAVPEDQAWPGAARSRVAQLIEGVGLEGELDYEGTIVTREDGTIGYDFEVFLDKATARPSPTMSGVLRDLGLLWPVGLTLGDVRGELRVTPEAVDLVRFEGRRGGGQLLLAGRLDLGAEGRQSEVNVDFTNLDLGDYLVDLLPAEGADRAIELWEHYRPHGTFDAHLEYRQGAGAPEVRQLALRPKHLQLVIGGEPVTLDGVGGRLVIAEGRVDFENLQLDLAASGRDDGRIVLNGAYGIATGTDELEVTMKWKGGDLGSPLIPEALRLIGAGARAARYRSFLPSGMFDATFRYQSPRVDRPRDYEFDVRPRTIALQIDKTPIYADLEPGSRIVFVPGAIRFEDLAGWHAGGRFELGGTVDVSGPLDAVLDLGYHGRLLSRQLQAFLPRPVRDVLTALDFRDGEPTRVENAQLHLTQVNPDDPFAAWQAGFTGRLVTRGASFRTGVTFDEVDGVFDVEFAREHGRRPHLRVDSDIARLVVLGHEVRDVTAPVELSDDGRGIEVAAFRGRIHGGVVAVEAWVGLADDRDYRLTLDFVGVPLGELVPPPTDEAAAPDGATARPKLSGELFAQLTLAGQRGRPTSRTGAGAMRVVRGRLAAVPLVMRLLQVTQLTATIGADLDYADVGFYVDGQHVVLDRILFESSFEGIANFQLVGDGTVCLMPHGDCAVRPPGTEIEDVAIDARFSTRGAVAIFRELLGGLGGQLYLIEVSGPLRDPDAKIVPLPIITSGLLGGGTASVEP
ncbi:MAG: hypothetical protein ACYTG1_00625 [Planctomycetota bacterium]|jgi:hypothetical protein